MKMFKVAIILAMTVTAFSAELPTAYNLLEKNSPELRTAPMKDVKTEMEHPVYKAEEFKNAGRARIAPVRPNGPVVKNDPMLADQPATPNDVNRIDELVLPNGYIPGTSDVAYPDIPYAPGYGYDSGYSGSNNYDVYGSNSYLMEPDTSAFGLLWSQVPDSRTLVSYAGRTIYWIFSSMFVILLGTILTVGVCSYTNLCSIHFHGIGPIHEEMRALISPERLEKISSAADFVKNAIDKYQKIQKVTDASGARRRRAIFT